MSGKIPPTFIQTLLNRTDIVTVIEQHLSLKKAGSSYKALCPFHNEKTPSFIVNPSRQTYHCFGCGQSGNAISFLMEYDHASFPEAVEILAAQAGLEIPYEPGSGPFSKKTKEDMESLDALYAILADTARFYHKTLLSSKGAESARTYLASRGIRKKTIEQFSIGYAPSGWTSLIDALGKTPEQKQLLLKAGLMVEKDATSSYDRFRDRIMIPIRDRRGRVIAFGGRVLDDSIPKYLNSPETPVFHKSDQLFGWHEMRSSLHKVERVVLVEGYMDVIALAEQGIPYAVATLGTATSTQQLQQLFRLTPEVIFSFDGDTAGTNAALRAFELLIPLVQDHFQAKFLFLPTDEDPDSLVRKEGAAQFTARLANATPFSTFFLNHLRNQTDLTTLEGRAKFASRAAEYLKKLTAPALRALLISEVEKTAKLSRDHFLNEEAAESSYESRDHSKSASAFLKKQSSSPVRLALIVLMQYPNLIRHTEWDTEWNDVDLPGLLLLKEIVGHLNKLDEERLETLSPAILLENWRDHPEFSVLSKLAVQELLIPEKGLEHELRDAFKAIRQQAIQSRIELLMNKANQSTLTDAEKQQLQELLRSKLL